MPPLYVALGDSMSIDVYAGGPGRGAASLLHRNRDRDFPSWVGRELAGEGYELLNLAQDGATTSSTIEYQLPEITVPPALVTLTAGGNDLFLAYGDTAAAEDAVATALMTIDAVVAQLQSRFPGPPAIVLTTVYDPSDGTGHLPGSGLPPWPGGVDALARLNNGLRRLAATHHTLLADVHRRFADHGQRIGDPAQLEPRPADRRLWYCGTIEPNAWGASEIRAAWWHALRPTIIG